MDYTINDGERYVPEIMGNEKEPSPVAFNLRYLTVRDQDELEYYEVVSVKNTSRVNMKTNWAEVFRRGVVSIENLKVNGKEVKTADEYMSIRGSKKLTAIMQAVALRIKEASEVDEKN